MQSIFVSLHNSAVKHRYEIYSLKIDLGSKNLKYIEMYMKIESTINKCEHTWITQIRHLISLTYPP